MNDFSFRQKLVLAFLAFGFLAMLGASVWQRFTNPSLTVSGMPAVTDMAGTDNENMDAIGQLMRAAAQNPDDRETLLKLVERMMAIGQWQGAENFAHKALALDPADAPNPRSLYLLSLIHYNQGQYDQAAELLEKMLERTDSPNARYNLGILYLYFLNDRQRGINHLKKGLAIPDLGPALRAAISGELEKAGAVDNSHTLPANNAEEAGLPANP